MTRASTGKLEARIGIASFFALLWLPLVVALIEPAQTISVSEQRGLTQLPELRMNAASLAALPRALDAYYDDHLGLRDDMIRAWAWLNIELLGVSPSPELVVGKQGWLFFGDDEAISQYRGTARFEPADLEHWTRVLEQRRDWLSSRGIEYLVVFVPNKHSMYAEYMPDSLPRMREGSQLDRLVAHLERESDVPFLDLREALQAEKNEHRIYHKTDTHWNDLGAYTAYRAIIERLATRLASLADHEPVAVRRADRTTPGLGLARIVGLSRAYPEQSLDLVIERPRAGVPVRQRAAHERRVQRQLPFALGTGDASLPSAVMFRDSFANALIPFLSESFERIVYVWHPDVNAHVVELERADVVIQEIAERFLGRLPRGIEETLGTAPPRRSIDAAATNAVGATPKATQTREEGSPSVSRTQPER